jgi:small subunit ribosomal protein S2
MKNQYTSQISLMSLFSAGAHRGNKKSKLNPRLKSRVFGYDKGLCLINLVDTKNSLESACGLMKTLGAKRKQVLVVGTSKHLQKSVKDFASSFQVSAMPYVNVRWPGGTLTNYSTIKKTLKDLEKLRSMEENLEFFDNLPSNQKLEIVKKREKKEKIFDGLVTLRNNKPGAVIILDAHENTIAIKEAELMNIPVIALANSSTITLPKNLDFTILCNINSVKTIELMLAEMKNSYTEGLTQEVIPTEKIENKSN